MLSCGRGGSSRAWIDDEVDELFGAHALRLVQTIGADDSQFLLTRFGHMLGGSECWQLDEIAVLASSGLWPSILRQWTRGGPMAEHIRTELDAGGTSKTYTQLCATLAASREKSDPGVRRLADHIILAIGKFSDMAVRKRYEVELDSLRLAAESFLRLAKWRTAAVRTCKQHAAAEAGGANVMRVARLASAAARLALRHESASRTFAEWAHSERRRLTRVYKHATPQPLRHYIFVINLSRYKDPVGLDWDSACIKYNNDWPRIIRAAGRPNAGVDTLLVGFRSWLLLQRRSYVQAAWRATRKWKARAGEVLREKPLAQGPRGVVVV